MTPRARRESMALQRFIAILRAATRSNNGCPTNETRSPARWNSFGLERQHHRQPIRRSTSLSTRPRRHAHTCGVM